MKPVTLSPRETESISTGSAVAGEASQDAASPSPAASAASSAPDTTRGGRSATLSGVTTKVITGHGPMYVTLNDDEFGSRECFVVLGKPGGTAAAFSDALGRMTSLAMTHGASPQEVIHQLRGIRDGHPHGFGPNAVLSAPDGVAKAMGEHYLSAGGGDESFEPELPIAGACQDCGPGLAHESGSGCMVCKSPGCGSSRRS